MSETVATTTPSGKAAGRGAALPHLFTVGEVAEMLRISKARIYELIQTGELEAYRPGGRLRVPDSSVAEYLARCKVSAPAG